MTNGQLTFEPLLNPSVEEIDEARLEEHLWALWRLFRVRHLGETKLVSTVDLIKYGKAQYNARLWELRRGLIKQGWCIDLIKRGDNGVHYYKLVRNEDSTFYKRLKEKGEA